MPKALWQNLPLDEKLPYHFWLEGPVNEAQDPNEQVLCKKMNNETFNPGQYNITIIFADVTCQQCLEWLHA